MLETTDPKQPITHDVFWQALLDGLQAVAAEYDHSATIGASDQPGMRAIISNNEFPDEDTTVAANVRYAGSWPDSSGVSHLMLEVDLLDGNPPRIISAVPHTLFAILYC